MKKQMSQFGMGMILVALLIMGFSHKRSYGKVPANSKNLPELMDNILSPHSVDLGISHQNKIRSLFVRPDGKNSLAIIMLVAHNEEVTNTVREILQSNQTPLIFSVSTLPFTEGYFDPTLFQFVQEQKVWRPSAELNDVFPLGKNAKFGGELNDGEIHIGVILLPEWFDITRPISLRYGNYSRSVKF